MMKHWCDRFNRFEGQPVRVFTDDGRIHRGILADVCENAVRLVTGRGCVEDIFKCHIDAIQEPLMTLGKRCCDEDDDFDDYDDDDEDEDEDDDECCGRSRCCEGCEC